MPSDNAKFEFSTVQIGALLGFWGGVVLGFAGCLVRSEAARDTKNGLYGMDTFLVCVIAGVVLGAIGGLIKEERNVQKRREALESASRLARQDADQMKRASGRSLQELISRNANDAVRAFASLPDLLRAAELQGDNARDHFGNGAFSPFWECVEAAYGILGRYKATLDDIARLSGEYAANVSTHVREHTPTAHPFPRFPVSVNDARASAAAQDLEASLAKIVYEAQKQPTFALIWEQRRNTSVLIAGFTTLTTAVAGMRQTLSTAVNGLASTIESGSATVSQSVASLTVSQSQLGNEMLVQMRRATTRLNEISELEKRAQGYPLI
ncbi:MAG TPA: hypothetical protein VFE45_05320 [Coriobacteriia bacterium]|nr:hypothetical protein [Coriobacteriia bacterium]